MSAQNGKSSAGLASGAAARARKRTDVVRAVTLGLLVVVLIRYAAGMVVNLFVTVGRGRLTVAGYLGAACMVGAGFNGASFLDFNQDVSSLIMALLAAAAIACYAVILYGLSRFPPQRELASHAR